MPSENIIQHECLTHACSMLHYYDARFSCASELVNSQKTIFFLSIVHCLPLNEEELLLESLSSCLKDRWLLHLAAKKWKDKQTKARISSSVFFLVMCPHE